MCVCVVCAWCKYPVVYLFVILKNCFGNQFYKLPLPVVCAKSWSYTPKNEKELQNAGFFLNEM